MENSKQSKVSMVVPCYNKEPYIGGMLRSVYNQVWDNIEVILVNDGSTDSTRDVITEWEPKLRDRGYEVVIIDQENKGCCAAVYAGLLRMTGEYFCLVDCDDEIMPEYVSRMAGWLDEHDDYEWAACGYRECRITDRKQELLPFAAKKVKQDAEPILENYILRRNITQVWIYMTRVSYIKHCKLIENFCTQRRATYEPLIAVPLMSGGGKLKFFEEPLYIFNIFAGDLFRLDNYKKTVSYYDDYLYLYKWAIYKLPLNIQEQNRLYKMAQIIYNYQVLYNLDSLSDGDLYRQNHIDMLVKQASGLFDPPIKAISERVKIQKNRYWNLIAAVKECFINNKNLPFTYHRIIGYGALGRKAVHLIKQLAENKVFPTDYWDISADGTKTINGVTVTKPQFSTLTYNDVILVFPKAPEICRIVRDESRGAAVIPLADARDLSYTQQSLLYFPEYSTGYRGFCAHTGNPV